jgi:hypothetical protein
MNENGEYVLFNVPVGKNILVAKYMNYQEVTIENVVVRQGTNVFQKLSLPKTIIDGLGSGDSCRETHREPWHHELREGAAK